MRDIVKSFWKAYAQADQERMGTMGYLWSLWTEMSEGERAMGVKGIATRGTEAKRKALR